ncbi:glycosyltransferase family 4 protein [Sphingobacterium sp. PCS056]|uniref:glycosyltransferase n=1 Tax=Sphingobacterium sp. PCS056 TaxID=2931400 RepID=UPI00200F870F|nr:glycosyltransferase [Sphingobacterium sp. PCS056]UPZ37823.1 glycosyltransferase family 4 protein [Sphingobacterium sp. PCS056]
MKIKLLVLTSHIPYPLNEGGKISQYVFAEKVQNMVDLHYVVVAYNEEMMTYAQQFREKLTAAQVHIIDRRSPKVGLFQMIKQFIWSSLNFISSIFRNRRNKEVAHVPYDDYERDAPFFTNLEPQLIDRVGQVITSVSPDLIQVEHNGFLNIVESLPQHIKKIFVEHEIQFARLESSKLPVTNFEIYKRNLTKTLELGLLAKYDYIFVFSEEDKIRLSQALADQVDIKVSPFPVQGTFFKQVQEADFDIQKVVFIGPEDHKPNYDAILWYRETIAQDIFEKTGLKTHVIGRWSEESINKLSTSYLVFDGFVEDIVAHNKNSLVIVPLRMGSGIRTKIIYSMAQNLPVISTSIGCEGLAVSNGKEILINDDINEFKHAMISLITDKERALKIACNGYKYVQENFSEQELVNKRFAFYRHILDVKKH